MSKSTELYNNPNYIECVNAAVADDEVFKNFKRLQGYNIVLEHTSVHWGWEYLRVINENMPEIFEHIEKFRTSDLIGGASPFDWPKIGMLSPSTLHYVKVLTDLIQLFDSMDNERIIEIGCGYGGQCKIISDVFNFKQYTLVDLPEVVLLIQKYLKTQNIPIIDRIRALPMEELPDETYDLVISNYAFTECDTSIQDVYIEKILNKSTHGYITCNFVSEACGIHSYPKDELLSKIKQPWQILPEIPLPYEGNFLLVW